MNEKIHHSIEFIEREEYLSDGYSDNIYAVSESTCIPEPSEGDVVTFGWFEDEESGEKVEIVDFEWTGVDYVKSEEYKVVAVNRHYHRKKVDGNGKLLAVNRVEVTVEVIVIPFEDVK